ncbi:helix-turn-helix domain-containing protein [Nocardiopsis sp. CNT-189]|uniref:helix-turn-helix domain-containing protein n=1 Tax=Nocardiopsis oceanisediminis TaxID=2816862 RepID=UPI003B35AAF3
MVLKPEVARKRFGNELFRRRNLAGLTQRQLATQANLSQTFVGAIERGEKRVKRDKVLLIEAALNTKGALASLWDSLFTPNGLSTYFQDIAKLERGASCLKEFQLGLCPGLTQTPEYARAIIQSGRPTASAAAVQEAVEARLARQEILLRADNPVLYVLVLDEAALRHTAGGHETMAHQMKHLLELAERPNVSIQVIPFGTSGHPGLDGSFLIIDTPDQGPVVYTETLKSGSREDDSETVVKYAGAFSDLRGAALPAVPSQDYIKKIMEEYKG